MTSDEHMNADWMSGLPEELWDNPLFNLAIPGSHDAMSYCLDVTSPLVRSESNAMRCLDRFFYCFTRPVIFRWATTQDISIMEQLNSGVRYFDLRIARKPLDLSSQLYFTHVIYTCVTVLETFKDVATWLELHPKEVIILACSHFEGLTEEVHDSFIHSLKMLLGSKLCPCHGAMMTLRALWASGCQVVLSYDDQAAGKEELLWPDIPYWWANKRTAEGVCQYLEWRKAIGRPDGFFVSGLNLTADRRYITLHQRESLRTLTMSECSRLLDWVREQRPGAHSDSINIIAGDFVGCVHFCNLVISLNRKLVQARKSLNTSCSNTHCV